MAKATHLGYIVSQADREGRHETFSGDGLMFVSKLALIALALSPVVSQAAVTKLVCATSQGSSEIRFVTGDAGLVKVFTPAANFVVDDKLVAPLFTGHPEKMNGVTLTAKDVPGLALTFEHIGEGDYGHPVLFASIKMNQGGKVAGGALGQCSLAVRYGY